ncbi:CDP-diacylglycerol--serine O-phosphatidyltransferase [Persicitalea jodogahamensis]|uniref:CDP-diacylglycerol--serine O-phosphatidyltransferase n=1 Tax=Persicitalea jodogahamensis TaxID=402147 RepID=A0A8J3G7M3_9BACT|nr:CDP-diacylglycerol--serine O-phosphatidyltransferase [Persicitalea jodogahamensis]GHB56724.1 CDP-diacylglycerol--serine O-phosphatidyltransferase [Persicitalea jodogahamensis]
MKRHIPNALTCANLLCGCVGIVEVFHNNMLLSCALIGLAAVFDFFDGFAARLLNVSSPIGKELDSLADMTTFGVLPAMIIYQLLLRSVPGLDDLWIPNLAFLIVVCSALRLAKFNIDPRQSDSFIGVPTPANALLIASLPFIIRNYPDWEPMIANTTNLLIFTAIMSYLLVAELPLFALKFKSFGWAGNEVRYVFLLVAIVLILLLGFLAVPMVVALYVLLSAGLALNGRG